MIRVMLISAVAVTGPVLLAGCHGSSGYEDPPRLNAQPANPQIAPGTASTEGSYAPSALTGPGTVEYERPTTRPSPPPTTGPATRPTTYMLPPVMPVQPVFTPVRPGQANVYTNTPQYNLDPLNPINRGQWTTITGPGGQPMTVWSTAPNPPAGLMPLPRDYPHGGSGYQPADTRWDPQLRR